MEGEKDLDVVEVDEADGGDGVVPSTEPLDCSGSSRSSSGSNGSITPPTDLKVKPKVRFCHNFCATTSLTTQTCHVQFNHRFLRLNKLGKVHIRLITMALFSEKFLFS